MKTYDTAMAKNYDWSSLPFKPHDEFLKRKLQQFELVARRYPNSYGIDMPGFEDICAYSPDKLFHAFVLRSVEKALLAAKRAGLNIHEYLEKGR